MDIQNIFLFIAAILNFSLGILIFSQVPKKTANFFYTITCFFAGLWAFVLAMFRYTTDLHLALWWMKSAYIAAVGIAFSFLYFVLLFPDIKKLNLNKQLFIFVPTGIVIFLLLIPTFLTKEVILQPWGKDVILGNWEKVIFTFYFISFFFGAIYITWYKHKHTTGIVRTQLFYLFLAASIPGILGVFFNLALPFLGNHKLIWLGPLFTVFMVGTIGYAMVRIQLFGIRLILTQLLVGIIAILLFINIFLSQTPFEYSWKSALLITFLVAGYLLIKSVLDEIKYKEKLQKAYEELKVLDKAKSEFISMASHQLRTPLSAIKGYISMILEGSYGQLSEKTKERLQNVFHSNERLIKIVNDLLNISRVELGKMEVEKEKTQIEDLIQSCYEEFKPVARKKNLKLIWQKPKISLPKIEIDLLKIRQVISNLIDNALRYTKKGEIEIKAKKADSTILISVRDTGEGLTPEEKRKIFEGFTRGAAGVAYWIEGAGLGLYVAKKYLELHQGKIWVESEGKGKGSTFFIELPLR